MNDFDQVDTWLEEYEAWLNSPVCSECGVHPDEEDEEHEEGCPYGEE